jgi:Leucine-rich repeat (LRR) protein/tRNA A-37 threonylcarbamoyl transferase component Bud32
MRVEDIFSAAVKIEAHADRSKYLDQVCADNRRLRARVEALLAAHDNADSFLETSAAVAAAVAGDDAPVPMNPIDAGEKPVATVAPTYRPITEGPGTTVGRYKLLQQIGEGGMGVVYMAQQEKPVRRRVALKIIKPGMDSRQVIARFEAERQALAMMDHPNIARVLDAACTDAGRPYFVMELVQGIPITKYCDDKQLDTRERLELFIPVCQAVQHAHQKGIIHRDIKPSNVLVMIYDSKPVPKIIDFGVAKALHQRLTEATMFTQFGAVVGTLEYMSPEQAEMDALGTDTRSDIYSLGVLLYELLTGSTPMDGKQLRSLGYAEMLKTIREVDPPKPSTRLTQSRADMPTISAKRHTEPRRLQKMIAGDLDWIVMKCLEKDRTRRYETANGLAADIQRHLADEAVSASPPGQFYKIQKLVRRNKLAFTAVACVMLALVVGLTASLWQAARATAALNDLRAAAPSIAAEARALAAQEKFDEAIGKLEYAAKLRPDVPDYVLAKADLLETQLRLGDAAAIYRAALKLRPGDARAKANAELCDQLAAAPKSTDGKLTRESLAALNAQMLKDQRPAAQIMPIARMLGDEKKYIVDYWFGRLKDLPNGTDKPMDKRLTVREDGLLELDLANMQIADLSPLAGMPLGKLDLAKCTKVTDLSPLRGMSLTELVVSGTGVTSLEPLHGMGSLQELSIGLTNDVDAMAPVSDLSPLAGLRLKEISVDGCPVTSLEPLRGMPLETLGIRSTGVSDLSPLKGMPLQKLDVTSVPVTDFSPLKGLPLEICFLQSDRVGDLGFLKGLPLKQLALMGTTDVRNLAVLSEIRTLEVLALPDVSSLSNEDLTAIENLRNHPSIKQLAAFSPIQISLANIPSKDEFWKNWDRDFAWALRLRKAGINFTWGRLADGTWQLHCQNQPLPDLSILDGAGISDLLLDGNGISDIKPLQSLPLRQLRLHHNPVSDLTPIRGLKLDYLGITNTSVHDLSALRGMSLKALDAQNGPELTDVAPLADVPVLESIVLPYHAKNVDSLRKLPNLNRIGFSWDANIGGPATTAEVFWRTWDGLPWARRLEAAGITFGIAQQSDGFYEAIVHDPKFADCSIFKGSNVRGLDLDKSSVTDLSPLADLPLTSLSLSEISVPDLSPLRSPVLRDALRSIRLYKSKVTDFAPIADCKNLTSFDVSDTALADLSVVKGMKLQQIRISRTGVKDIAVLAGMPLETAVLTGTSITDISPLLKCPDLVNLALPRDARDVGSLHALSKVARISYSVTTSGNVDMTADQFWASVRATTQEPWLTALQKANITEKHRRLADKSWEVILDDQPITDLSLLNGGNITQVSIMRTPVADLSPLRGMKLKTLKMSGSKVTDLSPLKGMPLTSVQLSGTDVRDLSPLAGMPLRSVLMTNCQEISDLSPLAGMSDTLETVILPTNAKDIEFLRKFPKLARLSYKFDNSVKGPSMTAAEFWAEYERAAATRPAAGALGVQ